MEMLNVCLPVIVSLIIGMIFRERKVVSREGVDGLQALVMNVTLPLGLFSTFYRTHIDVDTLIFPIVFFAVTAGGIFVGRVLCKLFKQTDAYLPFMMSGYEAGMLGYALLGILLGTGRITTFAMMDMGHVLAIFTVYTAMAKSIGGQKQSASAAIKDILTTPVLMAVVIGIIFGFSGLGQVIDQSIFGPVLDNLCSFLSAPTSVAILVVIGYRLKFKDVDWKSISLASALRILMQVMFAIIIIALFKLIGGIFGEPLTMLSAIMMIILPPPYVLPLYIKKETQKEFYSSALSAYTLLSIVGFIIITAVVVSMGL